MVIDSALISDSPMVNGIATSVWAWARPITISWARRLPMMKAKIEVECTPEEARAFLGLPDVTALNKTLTEEMQVRLKANMAALQPEELMKNWLAFGGQDQEQF